LTQQITMYGIKNCDTIKKAKRWFDEQQISYHFHDYRADGLTQAQLETFVAQLGYEALMNTRGTTWRKLSDAEKTQALTNKSEAIKLMLEQPAMIKRPLLVAANNQMLLGFSADSYQQFTQENA